jgi:hypothetical protein
MHSTFYSGNKKDKDQLEDLDTYIEETLQWIWKKCGDGFKSPGWGPLKDLEITAMNFGASYQLNDC